MKRVSWVLLGLGAALLAGPAAAASISERTTYFSVHGSTLDQIDRELSRKGPIAGTGGDRHPGATQVSFGGRVTYAPGAGSCRVGSTDFRLKLVKIVPRWKPPRSASAASVIVWRTLSGDIARHEEDHAKIARSYLRRMETAVRNLGPRANCGMLETAVNATTSRYLKEHERAQLQFDAKESREVDFRLRRLLRKNIEEAVAAGRLETK